MKAIRSLKASTEKYLRNSIRAWRFGWPGGQRDDVCRTRPLVHAVWAVWAACVKSAILFSDERLSGPKWLQWLAISKEVDSNQGHTQAIVKLGESAESYESGANLV